MAIKPILVPKSILEAVNKDEEVKEKLCRMGVKLQGLEYYPDRLVVKEDEH